MATMTYCAVENTAADLAVVLETMEDYSDIQVWFEDRNEYEKRNFKRLRRLCEQFLESTEDVKVSK